MKDEILLNIENPDELEKLFRGDEIEFKKSFSEIYPQLGGSKLAVFWNTRLSYEREAREPKESSGPDLWLAVIATLLSGTIAKLWYFLDIDKEIFYKKNIGFIVFPALIAYFIWKRKPGLKKSILIALAVAVSAVFINVFPVGTKDDTFVLSCIHLLLFLWSLLGFVYAGGLIRNYNGRIDFLRFNGDLVVMTTIMFIAGMLFTAITTGLFKLIGVSMNFYFEWIAIYGLSALPIAGTFIVLRNPSIINRVSPLVARIFSPVVLVTLIIYLTAIVVTGKDPYNDREFLINFNLLLIGVMSIILFSGAESFKSNSGIVNIYIMIMLSSVTIIVNCIALSAILFRISEWGITPNRAAVLGSNVLILVNLFMVMIRMVRFVLKKADAKEVEMSMTSFLPYYAIWSIIVTFIFPLIFGFDR